ncbi:MFS transporter [Allostreptomyces psammosilenae]|uniref:MFS family permease n=1 Tax=Allostreptomyces psammosilenae TaxID=1892865 RepID=A0A852ZL96_9ACTN|nr:MFS transporter [Allostreptomyces psammosilenae]NYI03179.1 MFS family permease [Allostreptomyces psammosilenae]
MNVPEEPTSQHTPDSGQPTGHRTGAPEQPSPALSPPTATADAPPGTPRAAPRPLRRARLAVTVLFFANAVGYANVVPRLPEIRDALGLSNAALGTAIAAMPAGALLAGLSAGALGARFGSGRLATTCAFGFALTVPLVGWANGWWMLAGCLLLMGALDSVMDAAQNAHGLRVQRGYGRSILNSFHGMWSLGAVSGGLLGTAAAGAGIPLHWHLAGTGVLLAVLGALAWPRLLPGSDEEIRSAADGQSDHADDGRPAAAVRGGVRAAVPLLALLGLMLVMASVIEDTPASWGSALLQDEYAATAAVGGLAYVAFQGAMTIGRFTGDRMTDRLGPVVVARWGGLLAAVPVALALLTDSGPAVIVAFGLAGLGAATLFPACFHAAGNIPGVRSGDGIAVVSWLARVGFLVAPPLIGLIGDNAGLRPGTFVVVAAGLVVCLLAGVLSPRSLATPRSARTGGAAER